MNGNNWDKTKASTFHRRSIRIGEYDYSQAGAYFVTICAKNRQCLFGSIKEGNMAPNQFGEVATACWTQLPCRFSEVETDAYAVMPNHIHGIVVIKRDVGAIHELPTSAGAAVRRRGMLLPQIIGWFKMNSAKRINQILGKQGTPVWQRNYWEHVVRDEQSLIRIREYVLSNPSRWHFDRNNPERTGEDEFDRWLTSPIRPVRTSRPVKTTEPPH